MPTLEMEKCQEQFTQWTVLNVLAVMIHPHKLSWRKEFLAMELAKRFADHRLSIPNHLTALTPAFFKTLTDIEQVQSAEKLYTLH